MKFCPEHSTRARVPALLPFFLLLSSGAFAQTPEPPPALPTDYQAPPADPFAENDRIFGVIPNFITVEDPTQKIVPLTVKQKFELFAKETFDPFTPGSAAAGAAISQASNGDPKYGVGAGPYAQRFGAAVTDMTTQNFFQDAVLASLLHEDPRYFRRGPAFGLWYRVGYALSRVVVTRTDSGHTRFNYSGVIGMAMGIALSNAYYPDASVNASEVGERFGTSSLASSISNLLPEFWPDIHEKFFHRKPRHSDTAPTP